MAVLLAGLLACAITVGCGSPAVLAWPADVRAAEERGPEIRPPEEWAHPDVAEAFHARGWFVLTESWIDAPAEERVGHCWMGTVRTVGEAGGDVVPSDFSEHGLDGVRMGESTLFAGLSVYADDHSFVVCEPAPSAADAVRQMGGECAAFGEATQVLDDAIQAPPHVAELAMNAIELTVVIRWRESALAVDRTTRRLAALGFRGEAVNAVGDPPRMLRTDDDWDVTVDLPPTGQDEVVLRARSRMPRRPICGPAPLPPPRRR